MILFDIAIENNFSFSELQHSAAGAFHIDYHEVKIGFDISEILEVNEKELFILFFNHTNHVFSGIFSFYSNLQIHQNELIIQRISNSLNKKIISANDLTADPYSFVLYSPNQNSKIVCVDPQKLDEENNFVIIS